MEVKAQESRLLLREHIYRFCGVRKQSSHIEHEHTTVTEKRNMTHLSTLVKKGNIADYIAPFLFGNSTHTLSSLLSSIIIFPLKAQA